jgi:hypothetical protein
MSYFKREIATAFSLATVKNEIAAQKALAMTERCEIAVQKALAMTERCEIAALRSQ